MTIETKHNIEEIIWMLEGNKAIEAKISSIEIDCTISLGGGTDSIIRYNLYGKGGKYNEAVLFKTKDDLLQSL